MKFTYLVGILLMTFLFSCSDSEEDDQISFEERIIGGWILEIDRIAGSGCQTLYSGVPDQYPADELGCVVRREITGSTKNCVNLEFRAGGVGTFLWSEINGRGEDAPITYEINEDNEVRYCFAEFTCSNYFKFIGDRLESVTDLSFDADLPCESTFVLMPK